MGLVAADEATDQCGGMQREEVGRAEKPGRSVAAAQIGKSRLEDACADDLSARHMNVPGQRRVKWQSVSSPRTDRCGVVRRRLSTGTEQHQGWREKRAEETERGQKPRDSCVEAEPRNRRWGYWGAFARLTLVRRERLSPETGNE